MAKRPADPVIVPKPAPEPVIEDALVVEVTPAEPTLLERAAADPFGAYAVFLAVVAGRIKLALPWAGAARQVRLSPTKTVVAEIVHRGGGNYNALVEGVAVGPKIMDEATAKALVDAELAKLGYAFVE